jgi:hypothetical protein
MSEILTQHQETNRKLIQSEVIAEYDSRTFGTGFRRILEKLDEIDWRSSKSTD